MNPQTPNYFEPRNFNVNSTHPLIQNSQEYLYYKKFVSIHSEDRDIIKYPNASDFEIELPEDMLNVSQITLVNWSFPSNYNVFSVNNENVLLSFTINNPYEPQNVTENQEYYIRIFNALMYNKDIPYTFEIESGFYNPTQMTTELTNKMNYIVTRIITKYFEKQIIEDPSGGWETTLNQFNTNGGYNRFVVVYNAVTGKIWFGNTTDPFNILSALSLLQDKLSNSVKCNSSKTVPNYSNYGLPSNLGLARDIEYSTNSPEGNSASFEIINGIFIPRFFYGSVLPGDNGFWLLPNPELPESKVHWIEPPYKINLMGDAYFYIELAGNNCIDETLPFNANKFTATTNQTNGVVNSSFAKISIPCTPISQWFDKMSVPYKYYYPPAERIRKFKIKLRYHNGSLVDFGVFNYSLLFQFTLLVPQIGRNTKSLTISGVP
jgi:hypothetical protein